jgi:hypothetical protein
LNLFDQVESTLIEDISGAVVAEWVLDELEAQVNSTGFG